MVFKKKEENVLIFDIGSASVGGAVVSLSKDCKPRIVFSTRAQMAFQEELNFDHFVHSMLSVLLNVSMELRGSGMPKINGGIDRVLCVLSSPWYVSQTRVFNIKEDKPFKITQKFVDDLLVDAEEIHKKDAVQIEGDPFFIEKSIVQSTINGYSVEDVVGKEASHLKMTILSTMMSGDVREKVEGMINKVFNVDEFLFRSFTNASYSVIKDLFRKERNFLLVDVSGETTNVSVVNDKVLLNSASFPLGHNFYKRSVQRKNYSDPEEAVSRIKIHEEEDATPVELQVTLTENNKEWAKSFKEALVEISRCTPLPSTLFLTGGNEYVNLFARVIKNTKFDDILFVEYPFNISILDIKQLRPCCAFGSDKYNDAFLILATIYMNRYIFASENS